MVALPGVGLSPARLVERLLALVRPIAHVSRETRVVHPQYPPRRESFVEQASMSREMYRL